MKSRWALVQRDTGWFVPAVTASAFATREEALRVLVAAWRTRTLTADAGDSPDLGEPFFAVLCFTGAVSSDGRLFREITWRDLPLPWMVATVTDDMHNGAVIAGRIDTITTDGNRVLGTGRYDSSEIGVEAARLAREGLITGVSIDGAGYDFAEYVCEGWDDEGFCTRERTEYPTVEICGATQLGTPAFAGAQVSLDAMPTTSAEPAPDAPEPPEGAESMLDFLFFGAEPVTEPAAGCSCHAATASAATAETLSNTVAYDVAQALTAAAPLRPPAAWFDDPAFAALTPLTITDEGRVFGHVFGSDACHVGYAGQCVRAPGEDDLSAFLLGSTVLADGSTVRTGMVTFGVGHADENLNPAEARRRHYDLSGVPAAKVAAGWDRFGVWIAGALAPTVTETDLAEIRGCGQVSGDWAIDETRARVDLDWRRMGDQRKLLAVLVVPHPGFPIERKLAASGEVDVLAAIADLRAELAILRGSTAPLLPLAASAALAGVNGAR